MKTKISPLVQKEIINIQRKDKKLANRIEKQILLFEENPKHPSLRIHKLSGNRENMWSISITMSIRMVYLLIDDDQAIFIKIGTHEQVYKK
jgi:addiction module RelE/StbE family toxin